MIISMQIMKVVKAKKISKSSNNNIKIPKGDSLISENLLISSMKEDIKEFNPDDDISNDKEKNQKEIQMIYLIVVMK